MVALHSSQGGRGVRKRNGSLKYHPLYTTPYMHTCVPLQMHYDFGTSLSALVHRSTFVHSIGFNHQRTKVLIYLGLIATCQLCKD